ncbi:hypothetical protein F2Q69_00030210 [Brassica cretica]|uniref:Uncharacterized protein n=1 Tax=Brassica cretica TaxID=69181 RepID=A0A8S9RXV9_BRACR|nr:hypothetical protein F2Q69_00030210 [Brassica cretica]
MFHERVLGLSVFSLDGSTGISARFYRKVSRRNFFTKITFRKNVHADFYGYLDVNFVVTIFDPNTCPMFSDNRCLVARLRGPKGLHPKTCGFEEGFTLQPPGSWTKVQPASGFHNENPSSLRVPERKSIQPPGSWTKIHPVSGLLDESPYNPRFMKDRIHEAWVSEGCISKPSDPGKTCLGSSGFQECTTQGHPSIDCSLPPGADCNIT